MSSHSLAWTDLQSRQIGESWKRVQQYRIDRGLPTSGIPRYGYLVHRGTSQRSDGTLRTCPQGCSAGECETGFMPDPETAPIVQRIFHEYLDGRGFQKIARGLNDDGIPTPGLIALNVRQARAHRRDGNHGLGRRDHDRCCRQGLRGRARDPQRPLAPWRAHQPLVTGKEWAAYQSRRDAQRQVPTKARSPRWSLAGIAVCGDCGGPMYCSTSQRGEQYQVWCGRARNSGACSGMYRSRRAVEAAVALWLQGYAAELEEATRAALAHGPAPARSDPHAAERRRLHKLLNSAQPNRSGCWTSSPTGADTPRVPSPSRRRAGRRGAGAGAPRRARPHRARGSYGCQRGQVRGTLADSQRRGATRRGLRPTAFGARQPRQDRRAGAALEPQHHGDVLRRGQVPSLQPAHPNTS